LATGLGLSFRNIQVHIHRVCLELMLKLNPPCPGNSAI